MPRPTTLEPDDLDSTSHNPSFIEYAEDSRRGAASTGASSRRRGGDVLSADAGSTSTSILRAAARNAARESTIQQTSPSRASRASERPRSSAASVSRSSTRSLDSRTATRRTKTPPRAIAYEVTGVLCLAIGALLLYNAQLPMAEGFLPQIGVGALRWMFGIGAIVVPALVCVLGFLLIARRHHANLRAFFRGAGVGFLVLLTGVHLGVPHGHEFTDKDALFSHGGYLGGALAWLLRVAVGEIGAVIALVALSLVAALFFSEVSLAEIASRLGAFVGGGARRIGATVRHALHMVRSTREYEEYHEYDGASDGGYEDAADNAPTLARRSLQGEVIQGRGRARRSPFLPVDDLLADAADASTLENTNGATSPDASAAASSLATSPLETPSVEAPPPPRIEITDAPPPVSVIEPLEPITPRSEDEMTPMEALEAQALATAGAGESSLVPKKTRQPKPRRRFGDGPLMPEYFDDAVRALDPPVVPDIGGVEDDIQAGVQAVQDTLASFKIDARVTDVKRGPVITRYEVQPAPGVRVAAIANLDRDMARSLSAIAVRIEAPVPGRNIVGIEVPNKRVHLVRLRDVLERHEFLAAPSKLAFVLGKDIAGQPKWADLTKMPHLLIAGATNSGKSVCLNSIIASILVRATPEEVKFSLIDPKRVELTLFKDIRHLYHPVVVEPKDAVRALRGAIAEMDRRYKRFAERGVRNIASYNSKLEEDEAPLPYIVIVIDELADLMMTAAAEFEKLICRLAQLARATGIHLIVATQRPSVNVITGVIKANIPARIAFAVASQVDSRTILDSVGAERLIGSGDMLFDSNSGGKSVRIQGAFLSEEEVNRVVEAVKNHYADDETDIEYGLDLNEVDEVIDSDDGSSMVVEKRDDLYDEIREFVIRHDEMSASMIQRKFEIGYPRAGRIVDQLERDGILSPADGSKPRKVIGTGRG